METRLYVSFTVHYVSKNINSSSLYWNRFGLFYQFISIEILNLNLAFAVCRKRNSKSR